VNIAGKLANRLLMKAVIQRVKKGQVSIDNKVVGRIGRGFLVFLGITEGDTEKKANWLAKKVANLRIMADEEGKMNLSLKEAGGQLLVVSQFTLYADCRKGNRPSFIKAAEPEKAEELYNLFIKKIKSLSLEVKTGVFGAMMAVELVNDGPVTLVIEK